MVVYLCGCRAYAILDILTTSAVHTGKDEWIQFYSWHRLIFFHPFYTVKWRTWFNEWDTWQKITIKLGFLAILFGSHACCCIKKTGWLDCTTHSTSQFGILFCSTDFRWYWCVSNKIAHQVNCLLTFPFARVDLLRREVFLPLWQ